MLETIETEPFGPTTSFTKNAVSLIIGPHPHSYQPTDPSSNVTCSWPSAKLIQATRSNQILAGGPLRLHECLSQAPADRLRMYLQLYMVGSRKSSVSLAPIPLTRTGFLPTIAHITST